ncbi:hypothetical protein WR25_03833 [Diploscapter pachys]|uniref:Uncharacterized protein n=1 Tax=Diploscapter pachys TaxID=2018661 RepID=A0A2A2JY53_9BILA|nr:hypothetical protein WR25_03833 [Diploscapter pachys]
MIDLRRQGQHPAWRGSLTIDGTALLHFPYRPCAGRFEGRHCQAGSLAHPSSQVDLVVDHHQYATPPAAIGYRNLHCRQQVRRTICARLAGRAHGAGHDQRGVMGPEQIEENAVSSSVSVPWVSTTAWAPACTCAFAQASASSMSVNAREALGTRHNVAVLICASVCNCGSVLSRAAQSSRGVTPCPGAADCMLTVPPRLPIETRGAVMAWQSPADGHGKRWRDQRAEHCAGDDHLPAATQSQHGGGHDRNDGNIGRIPAPLFPLPSPKQHTDQRCQPLPGHHLQHQLRTVGWCRRGQYISQQYAKQQTQAGQFIAKERRLAEIGQYPTQGPDQAIVRLARRRCDLWALPIANQRRKPLAQQERQHTGQGHATDIADHHRQLQRVAQVVDQQQAGRRHQHGTEQRAIDHDAPTTTEQQDHGRRQRNESYESRLPGTTVQRPAPQRMAEQQAEQRADDQPGPQPCAVADGKTLPAMAPLLGPVREACPQQQPQCRQLVLVEGDLADIADYPAQPTQRLVEGCDELRIIRPSTQHQAGNAQ